MESFKFIDELKPSPEQRALYELTFEIQRVYVEIMRGCDDIARGLGTTGPRILTLSTIAPRPVTVSDVARTMDLSRQNTQRTTDALAAKGLVEYIDNPNHRRAKLVQLTAEGKKVMREWARVGGYWMQSLAENIPAKQLASTTDTLKSVRERIVEQKG
jgi:DNA-binding MarR family transcriptional regulator